MNTLLSYLIKKIILKLQRFHSLEMIFQKRNMFTMFRTKRLILDSDYDIFLEIFTYVKRCKLNIMWISRHKTLLEIYIREKKYS